MARILKKFKVIKEVPSLPYRLGEVVQFSDEAMLKNIANKEHKFSQWFEEYVPEPKKNKKADAPNAK